MARSQMAELLLELAKALLEAEQAASRYRALYEGAQLEATRLEEALTQAVGPGPRGGGEAHGLD